MTELSDYDVTISRFTTSYPYENPDSTIVGFTISCKTNLRSIYKESRVFYNNMKHNGNEDKIIEIAWMQIKPFFLTWVNESRKKDTLIGKKFTPFL